MKDELTAEQIAQREGVLSQEVLDLCLAGVAQSDREKYPHLINRGANPNNALRITIEDEKQAINQAVTFALRKYVSIFNIHKLIPHPYPGTNFLLDNNADINHVFPDGRTLLDEYIDKSDESVARVLMRHNADLNNSLTKRLANAEKGVEVSNLDILKRLVNCITPQTLNLFIPKTQQSEVPITTQFAGDNIQIIKTLMEQMQKYNNTPLKPISDNNTPLNLVSNSYGTIESSEELHDASLLGDS